MSESNVKMFRKQQKAAGLDFKLLCDLEDIPDVVCKKCGAKTFVSGLQMKKAPGLVNSTGKTQYIPKPVLVCAAKGCAEVLDDHP